jgi:type III secretion protein D
MSRLDKPIELRVLDGEQRGASIAVHPGVPLSVSGLWHSDVVLRSPAASQVEVELVLLDGAIDINVRQGSVLVAGAPLSAGGHARASLYAPIVIGDTAVAIGELGASPWGALFDAPSGDAGAQAQAPTAPSAAQAALKRRPWPRRLVLGGGALAAASLSMLAMAFLVAPRPPTAEQRAHRAQALLHSAGFNALSVQPSAEGELVVSGYLDTQAQRVKAEQVLEADGLRLQWSPWINEQLAGAVQDVYRVNGVTAEVQAIGPGVVQVNTRTVEAQKLQHAQATARRDVSGLVRIETRNQPPAREPSPIPAVDDPGKRVASIVGGERPYVVTADGARYFVGALLPTGHRIQAIDPQSVQLEREGQLSTLSF